MKRAPLIAALLGAATVPGFAPFHLFPLPVVTLAGLVLLWQRMPRRRDAALAGFCFGLGYFLAGVSWVYISLHDFGAMPAPLAAALTLAFCAYLALYPALVGLAYHALGARSMFATLAALPALWTLAECLRGTLLTGFSWLELGYSQVPSSPLAGFVPLFGVHGATLLTAFSAALIAHAVQRRNPRVYQACAALLLALWFGGWLLQPVTWTRPAGKPLTVSLIQGNIPQEMKWRADQVAATLDDYRRLVEATRADLVVLPETALPLFLQQVPAAYLDELAAHVRDNHGDLLIGIPEDGVGGDYYNSVLSFGASPTQVYRKSHLVPFGEFVPLRPLFDWFLEAAQIPLGDFTRGTRAPQPLAVAGQQVAVDICYEDAFGAEITRQLPQATLLVNASNVAWFGRSLAPRQHLQISQTRALETGRYMLRATNTGVTAIIDPHGRVGQAAPGFTTAIVSGEVNGYTGATPYVRYGDAPVIALALLLTAVAIWLALRKTAKIRG
ncbi:MAG TPA: apolipoprotein N-acyltransferase [Burkholderiales bacterium]|nr:apolipoprotein N-acyltransferase [Burkholderiales bacterium]